MGIDLSDLLKGMDRGQRLVMDAAARAIDDLAEQTLGDAQQLCPVATGALQGSGVAEPIQVSDEQIVKVIGFNTDYAAAVHENLEANHAVGQAKYLSTALDNIRSKIMPYVADKVKEAMG